jgi:hypothetical protein
MALQPAPQPQVFELETSVAPHETWQAPLIPLHKARKAERLFTVRHERDIDITEGFLFRHGLNVAVKQSKESYSNNDFVEMALEQQLKSKKSPLKAFEKTVTHLSGDYTLMAHHEDKLFLAIDPNALDRISDNRYPSGYSPFKVISLAVRLGMEDAAGRIKPETLACRFMPPAEFIGRSLLRPLFSVDLEKLN